MPKLHVKSGDMVKVIAGADKGKTGKVIQVFPALNRVVVEGVSLRKRHLRTRSEQQPGRVVEFSMPIHASNVVKTDDAPKTEKKAAKPRASKKAASAKTEESAS